jgi:hypothetical protein
MTENEYLKSRVAMLEGRVKELEDYLWDMALKAPIPFEERFPGFIQLQTEGQYEEERVAKENRELGE